MFHSQVSYVLRTCGSLKMLVMVNCTRTMACALSRFVQAVSIRLQRLADSVNGGIRSMVPFLKGRLIKHTNFITDPSKEQLHVATQGWSLGFWNIYVGSLRGR